MPAKNSIKQYSNDSYYHIYNRGVEKRLIFLDDQDYGVFLLFLKEYLLPKDEIGLRNSLSDASISYKEKDRIIRLLRLKNFYGEITMIAYTLMPNHFHLFIHQKDALSIDKFMQSMLTRYTMYFNHKYKRVGSLFQAVYKAVLIENEVQFLYITKYIHQQALASKGETLEARLKQPSSLMDFLGLRNTTWVHPENILSLFSKTNPLFSYWDFIKDEQPEDNLFIQGIALDL